MARNLTGSQAGFPGYVAADTYYSDPATAVVPDSMHNEHLLGIIAYVLENLGAGGGGDALVANPLSQFAATTSAQLRGVISDESGTGVLYFQDGDIGTPSAGVATNLTGTAASLTAGIATLANALKSATTTVNVSSATAPTVGQVLTATSDSAATWQSFAGGGDALVSNPLSQFAATTSAQLRGVISDESGTGVLYFQGGDIGTPSAGVGTNLTGTAAGLTAGNVTTNANLTGPITSVGNATTIADAELAAIAGLTSAADKGIMFTGSGTAAVYALTAAALTVLDDATVSAMVDTLGGASSTGTGGLVRATSPTLVTPALGTPSSGVATNLTGTAAGLTAGNVTTNANLTGPVTSTGNATAIANDAILVAMAEAKIKHSVLGITIDGGGSAITTGIKGSLEIPYACTINSATLLADASGSIVIDVWKDTYANYPPTVADTITAAAKPTITTATKSTDATLTGWTTTLAKGDILRFNVDSATTITLVTLTLLVTKT